jgi:predicted signal transduction protein with EAL and GGDEF domain
MRREEMDRGIRERDQLQRDLRLAIPKGAVVPTFRPVVDLKTPKDVRFETAPRWLHPSLSEIARSG